mmetsp:Transcript_30197/g.81145  ORF Transcript_30197/g.81145 Transcript_30197/m.81145 type:complete len:253 (+) Transcript_30197:1370-2128(+)
MLAVFVHQELDGARRVVAHLLGEGHGLLAHGLAHLGRDEGRGSLLEHLLVSPLDRALALRQVHHVAMLIRDELDFNVPRLLDKLLHEQAIVTKGGKSLVAAHAEALDGLLVAVGDAHALAAAACRRLDHDRVPDFVRNAKDILLRLKHANEARDCVHVRVLGNELGLDLVAHGIDRVRARADELDALVGARLSKASILRQEAVARMDRVHAVLERHLHDLLVAQVGTHGALALAHHVALVRLVAMHRVEVFT